MNDVARVIADALADADRLFEDQIRQSMTRVLTVCGKDADIDLDLFDAEIRRCREAWSVERAKVPDIIAKALTAREVP